MLFLSSSRAPRRSSAPILSISEAIRPLASASSSTCERRLSIRSLASSASDLISCGGRKEYSSSADNRASSEPNRPRSTFLSCSFPASRASLFRHSSARERKASSSTVLAAANRADLLRSASASSPLVSSRV
ncbi:MAG: hypothetical protein BWY99_02824 [Synergistetes bacterium ADurb.BinA166]|nr:MAG: hypothetical protein BWY99_02824 [Synergistetes bacterium ADurb.BinA166]